MVRIFLEMISSVCRQRFFSGRGMEERARIGGPKIPGGLDLEEPWLVRKDSGSRRREKVGYFFCSLDAAELCN